MYFAQLRKIENPSSVTRTHIGLRCLCVCAAIGFTAPPIALADELVDKIEIENKSAVETGIVISAPETSSAASDVQSQSSDSQGGAQGQLTTIEYERGGRIIREYRSGGRLMYVETFKDGEFSYVFNHSGGDDKDDSRPRAGFVISNW